MKINHESLNEIVDRINSGEEVAVYYDSETGLFTDWVDASDSATWVADFSEQCEPDFIIDVTKNLIDGGEE